MALSCVEVLVRDHIRDRRYRLEICAYLCVSPLVPLIGNLQETSQYIHHSPTWSQVSPLATNNSRGSLVFRQHGFRSFLHGVTDVRLGNDLSRERLVTRCECRKKMP